jgi:5-methylcytosine-specific restriction endonuclease McrA
MSAVVALVVLTVVIAWAVFEPRKQAKQLTRYQKYLRSPEWKARRMSKLKEARFRCQLCNSSGPLLECHHRTYQRCGNEQLSDLIVLCRRCHERFHGISFKSYGHR